MKFTVYILYSTELDKYYVGYTSQDVSMRLQKHLAKHSGFTAKAKDWIIVHVEQFETKMAEMRREKEIKAWKSKIKIQQLMLN